MSVQDKLLRIQESAMTEARTQANAIVAQHREALERVNGQHRAEAKRQSETRIKAERTTVAQQISMASSRAALEIKRELGAAQQKLKKKLFEEVEENIQEYMKTEAYKDLLVQYIQKSAEYASGDDMIIYINPSDEDKKAYLEERTGMTLTVSKDDFIGGIRAVIPGRNILVDHAFKGSLEREYQNFAFKGGTGSGR